MRPGLLPACLLAALFTGAAGLFPADAVEPQPAYAVKPSDVQLPAGVLPGDLVRQTRPFGNWTLICDENLKKRTKICNVSQTIVDASGATIFSWSLAATEKNRPVLILRTPAGVGVGKPVSIRYSRLKTPIGAEISACDEKVCLSTVRVGPVIAEQIRLGRTVRIVFAVGGAETAFSAPLEGLAQAVAAID